MTIRTQKFKILQVIMCPVTIFVMNMQDFLLDVSTTFTARATVSKKADLKGSLVFYLVVGTVMSVGDTSAMFVGARSATSLFVRTSKNRSSTHYAWYFFTIRLSITFVTTKYSTLSDLDRTSIDCFMTS